MAQLATAAYPESFAILSYLFLDASAPPCLKSADVDDTGSLDISDAVGLLTFLFLGGPQPLSPFPDCGADPSPENDTLHCVSYPACN